MLKKYELNGKRGNESKTNTHVHLVAMYSFYFYLGLKCERGVFFVGSLLQVMLRSVWMGIGDLVTPVTHNEIR